MNIDEIDRQCPRGLDQHRVPEWVWTNTPFDDTCLNMNMHLKRYYEWEEMIYTTLYFVISIFALVGNGVVGIYCHLTLEIQVILAVIRKKEMRTNRNVLIVNLALSNLVLALITIPFLWWPSIDFEFPYSKFFCKFANALPGSNIYCSTLTISVMAIDRYYCVRKLNVAQTGRSQCFKTILISLFIWIVSFVFSFPLLVYYDITMLYVFKDVNVYDPMQNTTYQKSYGWQHCKLSPTSYLSTATSAPSIDGHLTTTESSGNDDDSNTRFIKIAISLIQMVFLYIVPLIVLFLFNLKLNRFLKLKAKQIRKAQKDIKMDHKKYEAYDPLSPRRNSEPRSSIGNYQHSNSEDPCTATPFEAAKIRAVSRRRSRTTALLTAMAAAYAILWFPFSLVSILIDLDILQMENGAGIIERIDQSCKLISILSICVNPFLYGFLNTNFRHEFTDIFTTCVRCFDRYWKHKQKSRDAAYASIVATSAYPLNKPSLLTSIRLSLTTSFCALPPGTAESVKLNEARELQSP